MGNDTFAAAVGAIVESHKKLYALLLATFECYKSGALPPRTKRVSRILDCEANGAHTTLENLASAAKAAPRGKKPETAIEKNAKVYNVRRKVGGKGPRTEFMKRQFRAFERFLTASNYDGEMKRLNSLAAQCWFKNKTKWDAAVKASGQSKGYSSAKVLANSYRNSE